MQTGLRYTVSDDLTLGAHVSTQLFRSGYKSVAGNLSVSKRF